MTRIDSNDAQCHCIRPRLLLLFASTHLILIAVFVTARKLNFSWDVPLGSFPFYRFPMSVFNYEFHWQGLPYLLAFIILFGISLKNVQKIPVSLLFGLTMFLIFLGNMGQGGWEPGFIDPIETGGNQYYHDALKIGHWTTWLSDFNSEQSRLLDHSKTHPPFAVLLHFVFLEHAPELAGPMRASFLSVMMLLIGATAIPLIFGAAVEAGARPEDAKYATLIYCILPAVNIYSAISLDAIVAAAMLLFLYGMLRINSRGYDWVGFACLALGLVFANLFTFGAVFLIAVGGMFSLYLLTINRKAEMATNVGGACGVLGITLVMLWILFGYNHVQGFFTASKIENPNGWQLLAWPGNYLATRIEAVWEIIICSLPLIAVVVSRRKGLNCPREITVLSLIAIATLIAMFISGAYRTGETARTCLFIVPYLLLLALNLGRRCFIVLGSAAAVQTMLMQFAGDYFW